MRMTTSLELFGVFSHTSLHSRRLRLQQGFYAIAQREGYGVTKHKELSPFYLCSLNEERSSRGVYHTNAVRYIVR
eukprot:scaffold708445_cov59-Attheya_sp.AAC.1